MAQPVRMRRSHLLWIFPLWLLGACSTCATGPYTDGPPELRLGNDGLLALSKNYYVVRASPGDTYMGLAWEHNVSPYEVISLNQVKAPYRLEPGEIVRIPTPRIHVVRRGDTLSGVAEAYRVDFYDLAQANALNKPFTIYPGQVLRLPSRRPVFKKSRKTPVQASSRPDFTRPKRMSALSVVTPEAKPEAISAPPRPRPKPRTSERQSAPPAPAVTDAAEIAELTVTEAAAAEERGELIWPVRGHIISGFGPTGNGRRNDGINIAVPERTPIQAAAAGTVIYLGNEVPGFGNLILIRHEGDLVTAYAHVSEFTVKKGEQVRKGQPIALSGSTGNVDEPQLHFEVRRGVEAVNPVDLLSA
jgi:murein DD-endopeptidase MepM/ murein hydrolase activator NlpD